MRAQFAASLLALVLVPSLAACQISTGEDAGAKGKYPSDTIEVVVGTAAGGPTDTNARVLVSCMEKDLDQTIVVKNVDGASGAVGNREVISAKPDGYTLNLTPATGLTLSPYLDDLGFSYGDVKPVGRLFGTAMILVTGKGQYEDAKDLFAAAEGKPGKITVGVAGPTSPKGVVLSALSAKYDTEFKTVPLADQAGVVTAMLGRNVDVAAVEATDEVKAQVESGKFVPLTFISPGEVSWLEDLPTLEDLGYPDAMAPNNEYPLYGPKGLPDDIVGTLETSMKKCVEDKKVADTIGADYISTPFQGADETASWLADSATTYQSLVK